MTNASHGPALRVRSWLALAPLLFVFSLTSCKLLDVSNPNNVPVSALDNPAAASAQVNGLVANLTRALEQTYVTIETASDNIQWIGSLDGMHDLNLGNLRNPFSEFIDAAMVSTTPARFMADQTVRNLTEFAAKGTLKDGKQLA
ncbi:MAG: hypothetical protein ABI026_06070, partial [Gemmatimonadaceae bacterium]